MATTVERALAKAAAGLLPGLLPTPPPPMKFAGPSAAALCASDDAKSVGVSSSSRASSSSIPGRADSAGRWDASKKSPTTPPPSWTLCHADSVGHASKTSPSVSSSSTPGRADRAGRWDASKTSPGTAASSSTPGRADSTGRWDASKTSPGTSSSSSTSGRADSAGRWDVDKTDITPSLGAKYANSSKRLPPSRASSDDRRYKKPRSVDIEEHQKIEMGTSPLFSGPSFILSPEPCLVPLPTMLLTHHVQVS